MMRPRLRHFFESMEDYFTGPGEDRLERLYAQHPGWDAPPSRMALYGRMVTHHGHSTLEKLYPLVRGCLEPTRWTELSRDYLATRPPRPFEMNTLGEGFASFLADEAGRRGLPDFLPALGRLEWADFAVYVSRESVPTTVERLTVNPTLTVLEHDYQLCAFMRGGGVGQPEPGAEMALLWRHPEQLLTMYMEADERALLVLKMALEGLTSQQVAEATGVAQADIDASVRTSAADGFVLTP